LKAIQDCVTTDAALDALGTAGLLQPVMDLLGQRIQATLERWVPARVQIGFICFTNAGPWQGVLVKSANADALAAAWRT
jgi:cobalt-precorrin-5B (C1)-methyltransferase